MEVFLDKSQRREKYSSADFFFNMGIPLKIDATHAIAHSKVMIIDGETVITGSFLCAPLVSDLVKLSSILG